MSLFTLRRGAFYGVLAAVAAWHGIPAAMAGGVWMADTGKVCMEQAYEDGVEEDFRHALALITGGRTRQGIRQLRRLKKRHDGAEWLGSLSYYLALAYYQTGRYEKAFDNFGEFVASRPEPEQLKIVQELQLECALKVGERDVKKAQPLLAVLAGEAHDADFAAEVRWAAAGLFYDRQRYHSAIDAYIVFIDHHHLHRDTSEAWFRVAASYYGLAMRSGRGRQSLAEAADAIEDFLLNFPRHERAAKAAEMLEDVRRLNAERTRRIADYYLRVRNNHDAALDYLTGITAVLPDTPLAAEAQERIDAIEKKRESPAPGGYMPMPLKGVSR